MAEVEGQTYTTDGPAPVDDDTPHERHDFEGSDRPAFSLLQFSRHVRPLRNSRTFGEREQHVGRIEYGRRRRLRSQAGEQQRVIVGHEARCPLAAVRRRQHECFQRGDQRGIPPFIAHGGARLPVPERREQRFGQAPGVRQLARQLGHSVDLRDVSSQLRPQLHETAKQVVRRVGVTWKRTQVFVSLLRRLELDGRRCQNLHIRSR
ncbi:MAG: hypothetical protein P8X94_10135, partial [Woeseiaceae bacterium]